MHRWVDHPPSLDKKKPKASPWSIQECFRQLQQDLGEFRRYDGSAMRLIDLLFVLYT
jgi:hypothetical protein